MRLLCPCRRWIFPLFEIWSRGHWSQWELLRFSFFPIVVQMWCQLWRWAPCLPQRSQYSQALPWGFPMPRKFQFGLISGKCMIRFSIFCAFEGYFWQSRMPWRNCHIMEMLHLSTGAVWSPARPALSREVLTHKIYDQRGQVCFGRAEAWASQVRGPDDDAEDAHADIEIGIERLNSQRKTSLATWQGGCPWSETRTVRKNIGEWAGNLCGDLFLFSFSRCSFLLFLCFVRSNLFFLPIEQPYYSYSAVCIFILCALTDVSWWMFIVRRLFQNNY